MYHDQGLAPFKSLSPDGVNFTAGLAAVRTSPDHGTAFDIAGKDKAANGRPIRCRAPNARSRTVTPHRKSARPPKKNKHENTGQTGGVFRLVIVEAPKAPKILI